MTCKFINDLYICNSLIMNALNSYCICKLLDSTVKEEAKKYKFNVKTQMWFIYEKFNFGSSPSIHRTKCKPILVFCHLEIAHQNYFVEPF